MKQLFLTILFCVGCAGTHAPITWPDVAHCAVDEGVNVVPQVTEVLVNDGDPSSLTLTSTGKQDLVSLGVKYGTNTIACVVQKLVNDWSAPGAAQDPAVVAAAKRGAAFLQEMGVNATVEAQGPEANLRRAREVDASPKLVDAEGETMSELLQFFEFAHLPPHLQVVSKPFCEAARALAQLSPEELAKASTNTADGRASELFHELVYGVDHGLLPCNTEASWAVIKLTEARHLAGTGASFDTVLRRVLEAKDCAVRSLIYKPRATV